MSEDVEDEGRFLVCSDDGVVWNHNQTQEDAEIYAAWLNKTFIPAGKLPAKVFEEDDKGCLVEITHD